MVINKRDAKLLLILLGIVLLLAGYFAVYQNYIGKTETVEAEISALQPSLDELQGYYANLDVYYAGMEDSENVIEEITQSYPTHARSEDMIMYAIELERQVGIDVTQLNITEPSVMSEFQSVGVDENGAETLTDSTAFMTSLTASCNFTYEQLKKLIDHVNDTAYRTAIDNISVSYDSESGRLSGSATIDKYYIVHAGDEFEPTEVPGVSLGTDELFGTNIVVEETTAETETEAQ